MFDLCQRVHTERERERLEVEDSEFLRVARISEGRREGKKKKGILERLSERGIK